MVGSLPLITWHVSLLAVSACVLALTAYLVYEKTAIHHRHVFAGYVAILVCWTVTEIANLLTTGPTAKYTLSLVANAVAVVAVAALGYFATVYTDRSTSLRKPQNALFSLWVVAALGGILTQPLLGLQYGSVEYVTEPFPFLAIQP